MPRGRREMRSVGLGVLTLAGAALAAGALESIAGVEAVYELPSGAPRGLVFLAHGCSHSALDFWPLSTSCEACIGLPEEVRIVRAIVAAGWGAIALSSEATCWSFGEDGPRVTRALSEFRAAHRLSSLPLAAIGASSGGALVLQLPKLVQLHAVVSQIMAIPPHMLEGLRGAAFPPTLFVHMPRDRRTELLVRKCVHHLSNTAGGRAAQIRAPPLRIGPSFFTRIPGVDEALSPSRLKVAPSFTTTLRHRA